MKKLFALKALLLLFTLSITQVKAQKVPMKFGKISKEELLMESCLFEKDANAMVLCEYGTMSFDLHPEGYFITKFYFHTRIKIFNKEGYDYANVEIPFYQADAFGREKVTSIKAVAYHLENGKIVETKLDRKKIFEEETSQYWRKNKFAIPNVKEGSVIEYTYQVSSPFRNNLKSWQFQQDIPVKWSEYRVTIPENHKYQQIARGTPNFKVQTTETVNETFTLTGYRPIESRSTYYRWVSENLKSLKPEPYTANPDDYATQVEFQLTSYERYDGRVQNIASNYPAMNKNLFKNYGYEEIYGAGKNFETSVTGSTFLKKKVQQLTAGKSTKMEKALALYEHVKNKMGMEGYAFSSKENFKKVYEEGKGTVADINLMLTVMFQHAEINAYPVILNTRSLGRPHPIYPNLDRFNYVVNLVDIDGKKFLVDAAASNLLPFGTLPAKCLNGNGWMIHETSPGWVDLQTGAKYDEMIYAQLKLTEEGSIEGIISQTFKQQAALSIRNRENGLDNDKTKDNIKEELTDWEISDVKWSGAKDIYKPVKLSFNIKQEDIDADMIYLNPCFYGVEDENPFKSEERQMPVDIPYAIKTKYVLSLTLPSGYVVDELPKPALVTLPNNSASFKYHISQSGQTITLVNQLSINKKFFLVSEYENLRKFYEMMIAKNVEQLVIRKATE